MQHPNPCLAIDITIPCAPKLPSQQPQTSLPAPSGFPNANSTSTPWVHEESASRKFCVTHAPALLAHGISILPFTIDHLSGLRSFASAFLYGTSPSCKIQPAEPPPNWTPNTSQFKSNPAAYQLYTALHTHTPTAILPNANKNWSTATNSARYGSTYHTHTPSQWGTQALTLNLSISIADHIKTHMSLHQTH